MDIYATSSSMNLLNSFSTTQIYLAAGIVALILFLWSFFNWRAAVKVAFLAAIFEGAIRKWVVPQAHELAYFLKDIFLAGAYCRFFLFPDIATRARKLVFSNLLIILVPAFLLIWIVNGNIGSLLVGLVGWKGYVYYLPLIFIVPHVFRNHDDLQKNLGIYSLIAIPVCLLGIVQFFSPSDSIINTYAADAASGEALSRGILGGGRFTRITGTFSYLTGMSTFVFVFTSLSLVIITAPAPKFQRTNIFIVLPLLLTAGFMTGSRLTVFSQFITIMGFLLASSPYKFNQKGSAALKLFLVLAFGFGISSIFFGEARSAFYQRLRGDGDTINRIIAPFKSVIDAAAEAGPFGYGIGVSQGTSVAMRKFLKTPEPKESPQLYYESEPAQVLLEIGLVGFLCWYALRIYLVFALWKLLRHLADIYKPLCFSVLIIHILHLYAQTVLNHTANFLIFGLYGIVLFPLLQIRGMNKTMRNVPPAPHRRISRST